MGYEVGVCQVRHLPLLLLRWIAEGNVVRRFERGGHWLRCLIVDFHSPDVDKTAEEKDGPFGRMRRIFLTAEVPGSEV